MWKLKGVSFDLLSVRLLVANFDSSSISECYVDRDLKFRGKRGLEDLPHLHAGFGYDEEGY